MNRVNSVAASPLVGAWQLRSFEIRRDDGSAIQPFDLEPKGTLIYTPTGRCSAQVMRTDRPRLAAGDQMKGTPDEIAANYAGVVSYFGRFEIDVEGGFVVHHIEHSLFPNWEGESHKRFFELDGNVLRLRTPPIAWGGGGEVVAMLEWERR